MRRSKTKSVIILVVLALLIAFFAFACFVSGPVPNSTKDYKSIFGIISKGIDLEGGYYAVLVPADGENPSQDELNAVIKTLTSRLDSSGYTEATITVQDGTSLRVEIPDVDDPDEVINLIGDQGELQFRDSAGTVYLTGKDISNAYPAYDKDSQPIVVLQFTAAGQQKFASATRTISQSDDKKMSIYLGDRLVSSPTANSEINSPQAQIEGIGDYETANTISSIIKSGTLDIKFTIGEARQMSATLGDSVVEKAMLAAGIGLLIIFAILILFYNALGVAAAIALTIYVLVYVMVLAVFPWVQLTFPGIAGIILSIGMAVDANVIIFDRIKDEYASGKTVTAAIKAGFKRATVTVLDSNVTTILASIVLWILTSGSIKGFAITLFLGVIISMLTSIFVTRWLIRVLKPLAANEDKFFGLKRREVQ